MKKLFLFTLLVTNISIVVAQNTTATFFADSLGHIKCTNCQAGDTGTVSGVTYEAVDRTLLNQRRDQGADLTRVCTSLVTEMSYLFYNRQNFNQAIENWDVSHVTKMSSMFDNAPLFNQPIGNWDVSNVTNMERMFVGTFFNQPLNNWDVSSVTNMASMFLSSKYNQPLNNWDVSNVTEMSSMFQNAPLFNQSIGNWDVSNVTNMSYMFSGAYYFNQPLNYWDVSNVTEMSSMFQNAPLFNQPIGNWGVSNVTNMSGMFSGSSSFNQPIGNWDVSHVKYLGQMFSYATSFNQDIGNWDVSNITNMSYMFLHATSFNQPIGNWDVSNVESMQNMFSGASSFSQSIVNWCVLLISSLPESFNDNCPLNELPNWGTCFNPNSENKLFYQDSQGHIKCSNCVVGDTGIVNGITYKAVNNSLLRRELNPFFGNNSDNYCTTLVSDMSNLFLYKPYFNQPIGNWDVSNVTNMESMFKNAPFNQPIGNWDVSNVTNMSYMFSYATSFNQDIGNWDVSNITNMSYMFLHATSFNQPIGNWDVSNVNNMTCMFDYASSFNKPVNAWCVKNNPKATNFSINCPLFDKNKPIFNSSNNVNSGILSGNQNLCLPINSQTLVLNGSNGALTWQKSTNYSSATPTWVTITGATDTSYNTGALTAPTAYRVIANKSCLSKYDTSAVVIINVSPKAVAGTAALNGTTDANVCSGGSKSLKLTGSTGSIQWQASTTSATTGFNDVSSATSSTNTFNNIQANTWYRAKLSSGACPIVYSNVLAVTKKDSTKAGAIAASAMAVCSGSGATLTLSGSSGTILWQKSTNYTAATPTWATATGTTATLSTGALTASTAYRAVLSNAPCPSSTATMVNVTVSPKAVAGTAAVNNTSGLTLCKGSDKPLKLTGSIGSLQWQASTTSASTGFTDVSGATTQPYSFTNIQSNTWYRAKLSSGVCPTVYSNVLAITAKTPTAAGIISGNTANICSGTAKTLTLSGQSGTIAWQKSTNYTATTPTWAAFTGTAATLSSGALTVSTAFRAVLSNAPCPSSTTDPFVVNVDPKVVVKTITANVTSPTGATLATAICASTEKILTLGAGYVGTIQWQRATSATGPWTDLDGATSSTYTVSNPSVGANYFRVKLSSGVCAVGYTTAVPVFYKTCVSTMTVLNNNVLSETTESLNNTILNNTDAIQQKSNEQISTDANSFDAITYPNPYENYFHIQLSSSSDEQVAIKVYDVLGKVVEDHAVQPSDLETLQLGKDLSNGEYSVVIMQAGDVVRKRLVRQAH